MPRKQYSDKPYFCSICGKSYDSETAMEACEALGNPPRNYQIGERLQAQSGVIEIVGTYIVLNNNGHVRRYSLHKEGLPFEQGHWPNDRYYKEVTEEELKLELNR